jgi:TPR repeat protein
MIMSCRAITYPPRGRRCWQGKSLTCTLRPTAVQRDFSAREWANMELQIKKLFVGGLLTVALFGAAIAGPLEDDRMAFENGDYAEALRFCRPLANQGNAILQAQLGAMYAIGQGMPQNYAKAVVWLRKAAEQREANGQSALPTPRACGV